MKIKQKVGSILAAFAASLMVSGTAAHAGPGSDWTGFYAGAFVGPVFDSNQWAERSVPAANAPGDWENNPAGVTLGYNHKIGSMFVVGGELDYTFGGIRAISTSGGGFGCGGGTCTTTLEDYASLRARVGVDLGKLLAFGSVGYGMGSATGTTNVVNGSGDVSGFVWGLGLEYLITNNLSFKTEYLNADLGRLELPNACALNCYTDVNFQTVRIGLNYQF